MSTGWQDRLFRIKQGDGLTVAGRQFLVYEKKGTGWDMEVVLITTRLFMSKTGPTNMIKCTLDELMNRVIVVQFATPKKGA